MTVTSTNETQEYDFDLAKTAREALHAELAALEQSNRKEATAGELARIESLAAHVGKKQHPDIETPGAYAAVWSQIASQYEFAQDPQEHEAIALELACFELAYPDLQ